MESEYEGPPAQAPPQPDSADLNQPSESAVALDLVIRCVDERTGNLRETEYAHDEKGAEIRLYAVFSIGQFRGWS